MAKSKKAPGSKAVPVGKRTSRGVPDLPMVKSGNVKPMKPVNC